MKNAVIKIAVCLAAIIFAVSCKEKPTESNSGVSDISSGNDYYIIKLDTDTSAVKKDAVYTFYVSPPDNNATVKISKVEVDPTSAVKDITLNPEDFILTPDLKDGITLTLSLSLEASGIEKFKNAKKATEVKYKAELDFNIGGQIKKYSISISVIPVHVTTKTEVENMIKALGKITVNSTTPAVTASFDFSQFQLSETEFEIIAEESAQQLYYCSVATADDEIGKQLSYLLTQPQYSGLGLTYENKKYYQSGGNDTTIIITYSLDIDSNYALEDSAAFITDYDTITGKGGIKVKLTLKNYKWLNY